MEVLKCFHFCNKSTGKGVRFITAFKCGSAGLFPVIDEPSQYYNCYYNGQKYVFVKMPCPPGTVFGGNFVP
jgi:hypothetical protein